MAKVKGRFWLPDWVVDFDVLLSISGADTKVLVVLSRFANKSGVAWPSVPTIATLTGLSERTVQRSLRTLAGQGLIAKITPGKGGRVSQDERRRRRGDGWITTKYRILFQSWLSFEKRSNGDKDVTPSNASGDKDVTPSDQVGRQNRPDTVTKSPGNGDNSVAQRNSEGTTKELSLVPIVGTIGRTVGPKGKALTESELQNRATKQIRDLREAQETGCH